MSRRVVIVFIGIVGFMAVCIAQTRDGTTNQLDVLKDQYARAVEKAQMDYGATLVDLRKKYVAALDALMQSLTKQGDLDGALAVRAEKSKEPEKTEAPSFSQPVMKANCFVSGDDQFTMCVNGVEVGRFLNPVTMSFHVSLKVGDLITVKMVDTGGVAGFGCVIRREGGKDIVTNTKDWKTYQPQKTDQWWVVDDSTVARTAGLGTNRDAGKWVESLCGVSCESIWSATPSAVAYLMFRVK